MSKTYAYLPFIDTIPNACQVDLELPAEAPVVATVELPLATRMRPRSQAPLEAVVVVEAFHSSKFEEEQPLCAATYLSQRPMWSWEGRLVWTDDMRIWYMSSHPGVSKMKYGRHRE